MATDLEKLVVQLAADVSQYKKGMEQAAGVTSRQARAIERRWRDANRNLDGIGRNMALSIIAPLAGIGAALGTREIMSYADAWTQAGNLIAAASQVAGRSGRSLEGINQIAQLTRSGFSETADLYAKILRATSDVAESEKDVAAATEIVNKAFKAGGAGAAEMAGGIMQLSQGLSSGVLQGDELRSVRENAPLLAKAIADYFGTTVAGLKQLGSEGKLTSDKIFKAILSAKDKIDGAFNATAQTIGDAVTKVNNAFTQFIGQSDESLGASGRLVAGLNALADNFDHVADVTLKVAGIIAGALVGRSIAGMIVKLGLGTQAVTAFVAALRAASIATAIGGISAAAGPLGLLIGGAVAGALALYYSNTQDATAGSKEYAAALKQVEDAAKKTGPAVENAAQKVASAAEESFTGAASRAKAVMSDMADDAIRLINQALDVQGGYNPALDEQVKKLRDLYSAYKDGKAPAEELKKAIDNIVSAEGINKFVGLSAALGQMIGKLKEAADVSRAVNLNHLEKQLAEIGPHVRDFEQAEKLRKSGEEYLKDAQKHNALSKDQLKVEKAIATIKKDPRTAGLSDDQIKQAAKDQIAADARRSAEGKTVSVKRTADSRFDQDIQGVRDRTAALVEEQKIVGLSTEKQESRRLALDLEQSALKNLREEARRKGETDLESIRLSDEQRAKIEAVAAAYGKQYAELERLNGPLATFARQSADVGRALEIGAADALNRMADDLADVVLGTKSVADAFKSMSNMIIAELARIAIKKAIVGPLAGVASNLFGGGGGVTGGMGLSLTGTGGMFADGGYTGPGGKYQPAGTVHKGEYVFDADSVKKIGVNNLERLRKSFATGGAVDIPAFAGFGSKASAPTIQMNVYNESKTASIATRPNGSGGMDIVVRDMVRGVISDDVRSAGPISKMIAGGARGYGGR